MRRHAAGLVVTGTLVAGVLVACTRARADQPAPSGTAVLETYCGRCHGPAKAEGDFGFVADPSRMIAEGLIVPGDAARSPIVRRVVDGEMPPEGVRQRPSAAEIAVLRAWVDGMVAPPPPFRDDREIAAALAADAARLPIDARGHARWFSLVHLANAGVPDAQLDRYRTALAKLLASLTWSSSPPAVVAIDRERTLFRVDLRELGWTSDAWDALRAAYPYGVARGPGVPEAVRADWFVATASRPPLYHHLLALPATEDELARRLDLDLADDLARFRVARAGFTKSGVSANNRVIERHATRHGAYWRSYDFASSVGRENVFAHPLAFVPAGGEIIFNLPDGFQAYMLVDGHGRRLDKAPTTIVSDPRRPDRAVENGVSCMGCHASGIIPRADELRAAADDVDVLDRHERERVRRLHPPAGLMSGLFDRDRVRFARALATISATPTANSTDEPITVLVARYEAELDARLAAAELGLRTDELVRRLPRSPHLRRPLAPLAGGGTVKRDSWEAAFARAIDELGVGIASSGPTSSSSPATPEVWLDRDRATWIVAGGAVDQATAVGICHARGWALPRAEQLRAAVRTGLSAALRLHRPLWTTGTRLDVSNLRYAAVVDPRGAQIRRADVADRNDVVCVKR